MVDKLLRVCDLSPLTMENLKPRMEKAFWEVINADRAKDIYHQESDFL